MDGGGAVFTGDYFMLVVNKANSGFSSAVNRRKQLSISEEEVEI